MVNLTTLRNHWKKSLFLAGVAGYGLYYAKTSYDISQHMRNVCTETIARGKVCDVPKHILVVLNPAANKRKAEKMFKEYCEPILHLAGFNVDIIKTTEEGHIKMWINDMTVRPHAIVIAGGDGTASEVVTGLMRRKEGKCPIVLLPLGRHSSTALKYIADKPKNKFERVKSLTASLMPLLQENVRNESVMKLDFINSEIDNEVISQQKSSIYGLNSFSWGLLTDIESITDKYWYYGPLRQYAAALLNSFSTKINWNLSADFICTPPCAGCLNCQPNENKPYKKNFLSRMYTVKEANVTKLNTAKVNEECATNIEGHMDANQLNIISKQNTDSITELQTSTINTLTRGFDFIKQVNKVIDKELESNVTLKSRTIQLLPKISDASGTHYTMDGEEYDVRPIRIEVIPNAIQVFCN